VAEDVLTECLEHLKAMRAINAEKGSERWIDPSAELVDLAKDAMRVVYEGQVREDVKNNPRSR
jgi:hypothetical protein